MTSPSVLFLFPDSRDALIDRVRAGQDADTTLWGFNHIPGAMQMTAPDFLRGLFLLPHLLRYDTIIAQDTFLLGYLISLSTRIFRRPTRWIYIAMTSSTLMRRHATHPVRLSLLKKVWMSYHRIVCLSSAQLEDLARLGIVRDRLVHIPFGIDTPFFKQTATLKEEQLVVAVGRDAGRDYKTLIQATEQIDAPCIIVAAPKNIPADIHMPPNVSLRYNRPLAEVRALYARAALVVVASKDETIPEGSDCSGQIAILDAMAAGKAVIATRRSWMKDYFVPGEDLILVEPQDPQALADATSSLLADRERRNRLAASGRTKVIARYTTGAFAAGLRALL